MAVVFCLLQKFVITLKAAVITIIIPTLGQVIHVVLKGITKSD